MVVHVDVLMDFDSNFSTLPAAVSSTQQQKQKHAVACSIGSLFSSLGTGTSKQQQQIEQEGHVTSALRGRRGEKS